MSMRIQNVPGLNVLLGATLGTLSALANAGLLSASVYVSMVLGTAYLWIALASFVAWTARTGAAAARRCFVFLATAVMFDTGVDYALDSSVLTSVPDGVALWQVVAVDLWWLAPALLLAAALGICVAIYARGGLSRLIVVAPTMLIGVLALSDISAQGNSPAPISASLALSRVALIAAMITAALLVVRELKNKKPASSLA